MKKVIAKNIILSLFTLAFVAVLNRYSSNFNISLKYFVATFFHLFIYCLQALILNRLQSKKSFVMIYGLLSFLKICLSIFFIITYLLFFSAQESQESQMMFLGFFILLYFGHLLINTILVFSQPKSS